MNRKLVLLIFVLIAWSSELQAQCAMCRAVLESQPGQSAAEGINQGILYLMVFPYLLMAGVAYMIWRSRKKSKKQEQ